MQRQLGFSYFFALLWGISSSVVNADVSERDWENTPPGNGLLTFDDVNNREWLDLTETLLEQFSDNPGDDKFATEDEYQNVIAQLAPGGLFEEFTVAVSDDVTALSESAGIVLGTLDFATNEVSTLALIELLGDTVNSSGDGKFSAGFLDENVNLGIPSCSPCRLGATFRVNPSSGLNGNAGAVISATNDLLATTSAGVMLFRDVPEPSSAILVVIGCLALLLLGRRTLQEPLSLLSRLPTIFR